MENELIFSTILNGILKIIDSNLIQNHEKLEEKIWISKSLAIA